MVQGAWGVVPVHLNELSPAEVRAGTFPGLAYQLGNCAAAYCRPTARHGSPNVFAPPMAIELRAHHGFGQGVVLAIIILAAVGKGKARDRVLGS